MDYGEFKLLFPVRVARMKEMEARMTTSRSTGEELTKKFMVVHEGCREWLHAMQAFADTIKVLSQKTIERGSDSAEAAKGLKKQFGKVDEALKSPPGPTDAAEILLQMKAAGRAAKHGDVKRSMVYRFDGFLQDMALQDMWHALISNEGRMLKQALMVGNKFTGTVDQYKAHDAAESVANKLKELLRTANGQMDEYEAFVETMDVPEVQMREVSLSGRGLRPRDGDKEDEPGGPEANVEADDRGGNIMTRFFDEVTARFSAR